MILSLTLSTSICMNTTQANMPVFDFSNLSQSVMSYYQQIQDIMMYEKELAAMGIDFSKINSFIHQMQDGWEQLQDMKDKLEHTTNLDNVWNALKNDCNELKKNPQFAEMIQQKANAIKGYVESQFAETQACAELLGDKKVQEQLEAKNLTKAQQCLIDNDRDCYEKTMKKVYENREKIKDSTMKKQYATITKITSNYSAYDNSKSGERKKLEEDKKKLEDEMKQIYGKDEKTQREIVLKVQQMILEILMNQYDLMQNTSNMLATMIQQSKQIYDTKIEKKEEDYKLESEFNESLKKCQEVQKDSFGFPNYKSGGKYCE